MEPVKLTWSNRLASWRNKMFGGPSTTDVLDLDAPIQQNHRSSLTTHTGSCGPDSPIRQDQSPGFTTHPCFGPDQDIPRKKTSSHPHIGGPG